MLPMYHGWLQWLNRQKHPEAPLLPAASIEGVAKGPRPAKMPLKNKQIETQDKC